MDTEVKTESTKAISLYSAVSAANIWTVESMLAAGCNPNQPTDDLGMTPLHAVAYNIAGADKISVLDTARLLLDYGAQMLTDKIGRTPMHLAFYRKDLPFIALLLGRVPEDARSMTDRHWPSILDIVCIVGADLLAYGVKLHQIESYTEKLIQRGADVNKPCENGQTPLHFASSYSDASIVSMLLNSGADLEATDINGLTPLLYACTLDPMHNRWNRNLGQEVMERRKLNIACLLERGASVHAVSLKGHKSVLHLLSEICRKNNAAAIIEIAELLIKHGAYVNIQDDKLRTPLYCAVSSVTEESYVNTLLRHGADVNVQDNNKRSLISALWSQTRIDDNNRDQLIIKNRRIKKVWRHILRHVQRLKILGLYVDRDAMNILQKMLRYQLVHSIETECIDELESMKLVQIDDNTTLYRLLQRGRDTTGLCLDDSRLQSIMEEFDIAKNYPNYAYILQSQVRRVQLRVAAEAVMRQLAHCALPSLCCEAILDYLMEADLLRLVAAGEDRLSKRLSELMCKAL